MLEAFLELFLEVVVNVFVELLFNGALSRDMFTWRTARWLVIILSAGTLGWASTAILPKPLIPWPLARGIYVLIAPVLIAVMLDWWNQKRIAAGRRAGLLTNFADAWLFAFSFSLVRFLATI